MEYWAIDTRYLDICDWARDWELDRKCNDAFESGDHAEAVRLLPLVKELHRSGGRVFYDKETLLHLSSRNGWLDVTKDLITNYHFDPQKSNDYGKTCLHYAAEDNHVDMVRYLITECNCDPMATDKYGNTVLHYAAACGSLNVMKYLINHHNCNPIATNEQGETILHCAMEHIEVVKYLIIECNYDPMTVINDHRDTVLHYAANKGLLDLLKAMINHHNCRNLMATNEWGKTILHCAMKHIEVVKYLIIECNCDPMTVINNDGDTVLHYAAKKGLFDLLKAMINHHNCNPMATNEWGETILHCAVEHIEVVKYLIIECNCDPMTVINDHRDTVLHYAAKKGLLDLLKFMINHYNCNPMATNKWGETILCCAMEHIEVVKYLIIECNCDPMTVINDDGDTVLHYIAKKGLLDLLKAMINHYNCYLMATNKWGETILHCAMKHIEVVKYLIIECNCDPMTVINNDGDTVLHYTAKKGLLDLLKAMINHHNCYLMATNKRGETILHCAMEHIEVVKYLVIECNCDPMATDDGGDNVLHYAARKGLLDVLKFIINHSKCNLMATNKKGETILHCAVEMEHIEVVKYLIIECNCDPMTVINDDGDTVFHYAAKTGLLDLLKFMINHHNCNLMATNKRGETIFHCAVEKKHIEVVRYLIIECNCDPMTVINDGGDTVLHYAAKTGLLDLLKFMINHHNCNLMATNKRGETIFHCAVEKKHIEVVRYLIIECNCDPMTVINDGGDTVLHYAAKKGLLDVMKYLINHHNCNPMATNKQGEAILHCAVKHIEVVKYLIIECNCDPMTVINNDGDTVLHYAAEKGLLDVMKYLINHHNCNPMATNKQGEAILHCAVKHIEVVKYLIIECNCDPMTVINNDGDTVLHYAARKGLLDLLKSMINHHNCYLMATNKRGETIFCCAMEHIEVVKYLIIECNCDPMTIINDGGDTVLHYAAKKGLLDLLKFMINHHNCNLMATNKCGETILHCAVGHIEVVKYLIIESNCDPMTDVNNYFGDTVLHYAAKEELLDSLKAMINHHNCNPMATNKRGETILYCAEGHIEVVKYLIIECNCDPMTVINYDGDTVLHYAARKGLLDLLKAMINHHNCNLMATNKRGKTILHCAVEHIEVVKYLIIECNCDPMTVINYDGDTVLHYAARKGLLDLLKAMINHHNCNLMATNKRGKTILHCAVEHIEVVKYLINEHNCDPMVVDKLRRTPLHIATYQCFSATIECLLSTGRCDPWVKDNIGRTPVKIAEGNTAILPIFKKFGQIKVSHPIDSYVNVLLLGNPGAGKSTLRHVISDTVTGSFAFGSFRNVKGVEPFTAGIIPVKLHHKTLGNIILHDFAGHPEYYSSHSAVIGNLLQGSGGVFLIVVNILEKETVKQLHQWLTVVRNEAQKACNQCHMIVVVSHVDEINDPVEKRKREEEIQEIIASESLNVVFLDCRKLGGSGIGTVFKMLSSACESIRSTRKYKSTLYHHEMYRLLVERKENLLIFSDAMSGTKDSYVLPEEREELFKILHSLDSTGLINVLQSEDKVWVVVNKGILLTEVDGILFAPKGSKKHVDIASNTGIVRVSALASLFPHYDPDMLICFLKKMELCQEMNPSFLSMTNLIPLAVEGSEEERHSTRGGERLLFFPCLLYRPDEMTSKRPDEMTSKVYQFGWCLQCTGKHDYFPPRYFHVLSLHLAYKMALPREDDKLNRRCTFWWNGLHWLNDDGVGVLVEIVDENQCVLVLMSQEKGCSYSFTSFRRDVIREVLLAHKESCPSLEVKEFIIDPEELSYPVDAPKKRTLHSVKDVISLILRKKDFLVNATGTRAVELKSILTDESLSDINNLSLLGGRDIKVSAYIFTS